MISKKREGAAMLSPLLFLFTLFTVLLILIFAYKAKTAQIYGRLDDAVAVSCQSVCIPDRYVPGAYHWNRADVVFATRDRSESEYYFGEPETATAYAADLAYARLGSLLDYNFPPMVTDYVIEEFQIVNIISGTAYGYDCISGSSSTWDTAEEESYMNIRIEVLLELPAFGAATWRKEDKAILREEAED